MQSWIQDSYTGGYYLAKFHVQYSWGHMDTGVNIFKLFAGISALTMRTKKAQNYEEHRENQLSPLIFEVVADKYNNSLKIKSYFGKNCDSDQIENWWAETFKVCFENFASFKAKHILQYWQILKSKKFLN